MKPGVATTAAVAEPETLLRVRGLSVVVGAKTAPTTIVDDVSFEVLPQERIALVGESGSGKTMTALAVMRLLDERTASMQGAVWFGGTDLATASAHELQEIRGPSIAYVPQDPTAALNPVFTIGFQLRAVLRSHEKISRQAAEARAIEMLGSVGIPNPKRVCDDYPHQLSGGMRQRCVIAAALICHPRLVIADEPTTSLDVTIQAQIFDLLNNRAAEEGLALLLITHDLGIVSVICDRVLTMYAGQIVETGSTSEVVTDTGARHPYTKALLECAPSIDRGATDAVLYEIAGEAPSPGHWPGGCRFAPRCPIALDRCTTESQRLVPVGPTASVRCWRVVEASAGRSEGSGFLAAADENV